MDASLQRQECRVGLLLATCSISMSCETEDGADGANGTDGTNGTDGEIGEDGIGFDDLVKYGSISL